MARLHPVSLGCPKNLVDSEVMLGLLGESGWEVCDDPREADLLLVNTCGFIQSAVEEAVEEILGLAKIKEESRPNYLVVTGCLVERYREDLLEDLPEVDLFVSTEGVSEIATLIEKLTSGRLNERLYRPDRFLMDATLPRIVSSPHFQSWLKLTEGCDNRCSYCMIPSIRGSLRSRPIEDLVVEANRLAGRGVKELCLIAQDLTAYGNDLGLKNGLEQLLPRLLESTDIPWIRLLYLYPSGITGELLSLIKGQQRILPYLDIPFQHVSDPVLKRMNRHYDNRLLYNLVDTIRATDPEIAIRTTIMVGFPGETESDMAELERFLRHAELDHVGLFSYANEPGSASEHFSDQCSEEEKKERFERISSIQADISSKKLKSYVGRIEPVIIEGLSRESDLLLEGRTRFQAPQIDGCVYITEGEVSAGDIVDVRIDEAQIYDLVGAVLKRDEEK
ncbi:MAG: 30S ribosomal protein S12 methylthiotransferase RimO [Thermodesulfobacteriota bacterium]